MVHELTKEDKYVILASDGLWDEVSGKEAAEIAKTVNSDKHLLVEKLHIEAEDHAMKA